MLVFVVAENKYTFYEWSREYFTREPREQWHFFIDSYVCVLVGQRKLSKGNGASDYCMCILGNWSTSSSMGSITTTTTSSLGARKRGMRKKPPIIIIIRFRFSRCRRSKQEEKITERDYSGIFKGVFCCYSLGASRSSSLSGVCSIEVEE